MKKIRLDTVCEITAGQGAPQGENSYSSEGIPFVKAGDLVNLIAGKKENEIQKVSEEVAKEKKLKLFPAGSVLFAKSGMSCMKGHVYQLKDSAYVVSHLAVIMPRNIDSNFLRYYFTFDKPNKLVQDAAYPAISLKDIASLEIPHPPLPDQQKIAAHLDSIQSAIDNKKQQLQQLDELVKSKFVEMFGDPIENEKNWTKKKLKETSKIITGNTPPRSEKNNYGDYLEWIKTDNITEDVYITKALEYLSSQGEKKGRIVEAGAILMACIAGSLSSIGRVALTNRKVAFNQQINAIIPSEMYNSYFLYILFNLSKKYTQSTVQMALKGILSKGKLEELEYIVPPIELQNIFAEYVQKIDSAKSIIKTQLVDLQELLDSKMNKYFGE